MAFELQKLLKNRIILICIAVSLVITSYFACKSWSGLSDADKNKFKEYEGKYSQELYDKIYDEYDIAMIRYQLTSKKGNLNMQMNGQKDAYTKAGLTKEEIDAMSDNEIKEIFEQFKEWQYVENKAEICRQVTEYRATVVKNAERLKKSHNRYIAAANSEILKIYSKKVNLNIINENLHVVLLEDWSLTAYADYINIILIIVMACGIFLVEHSSNTYSMVFTSYKGRKKLYFNKVVVVMTITIILGLITTLLREMPGITNARFDELLRQDIQNIDYFKYSPYILKVYQAWIILALFRTLGYLTIATIMIFITMFFRKSIIPFCVGTVTFAGGFAIMCRIIERYQLIKLNAGSLSEISSQCDIMRQFTPFGLIRYGISYLEKYEPNNLFNKPVSDMNIAIVMNILYCVIFVIAGYVVYRYRFRKHGV